MPAMTPQEKVEAVHDDLLQTYDEACQTYTSDVAISALAYVAARAVHRLEHEPRMVQFGPNGDAVASGVFDNAYHQFLFALRDACREMQKRGIN